MVGKVVILVVMGMFSINSFGAVPNTFVSGTKAKASEVNENFQNLDSRVVLIERKVEALGDANNTISVIEPHELAPYTQKVANIGDIVATIEGIDYVLGALPFREYGTENLYRVIMPLAKYACVRTESEINSNNGYRYTSNYQCANGGEYYYEKGFTVEHYSSTMNSYFTISGYPSFFSQYWGERATISASSSNSTVSSSSNTSVDPREYIYEKSITPFLSVSGYQYGNYLYVLVNETRLSFQYSPEYQRLSSSYKTGVLGGSEGPDFSTSIEDENLNGHMDQDLMNQYKDLYNYIRIERMN